MLKLRTGLGSRFLKLGALGWELKAGEGVPGVLGVPPHGCGTGGDAPKLGRNRHTWVTYLTDIREWAGGESNSNKDWQKMQKRRRFLSIKKQMSALATRQDNTLPTSLVVLRLVWNNGCKSPPRSAKYNYNDYYLCTKLYRVICIRAPAYKIISLTCY